jgi:TonB-dependent receptor
MRLQLVIITILIFTAQSIIAQSGSIKGVVTEEATQYTVPGATVVIEGTTLGAATDIEGNFTILNLPAGNYQLICSYIGFSQHSVFVEVTNGKTTTVDITLSESNNVTAEVEVTASRRTNSENAVLIETKEARQVVSGISRQQIQKSQDNNAAQVMQRVPGITIVDNRFVMVRGVSERYNSILINNVPAPSTEVDKRTFSFDLISSSSLDRMMVYKSGTPDMPGDFAGGVIKVHTLSTVDKDFTDVSLSLGYRMHTTFNDYYQSEGSSTDFLGFDNGLRTLPSSFPSRSVLQNTARNSSIRTEAAHRLSNNFNPQRSTATPDYGMGLALGRTIMLGDKVLSTVNTINYSRSFQSYQRSFNRYFEWVDQDQPILTRFNYTDNNYQQDTRLSVMSNWTLELNKRHRIKFSNLFNQIGENETIIREGQDYLQRPNDHLKNYMLGYRSRSIYTAQLEVENKFSDNLQLNWLLGGSYLGESEPDLRRFRTYRSMDQTDGSYTMQLPPSSNLFETGRYFGSLGEYSANQGLNATYTFNNGDNEKQAIQLKAGYLVDYRARDFNSRYFSYLYPGFFDPAKGQQLAQLPLDQIFAPENISNQNGFVIEEGTRPIDSYTASNLTTAGYVYGIVPLGKLNMSGGVRVEHNIQRMDSQDDLKKIKVNNPLTSLLPFLNMSYQWNEKWVMRAGYGRTLNRPEFRELAPFLFYDYKMEAGRVGNPDLKTAHIDNYDLRMEWYPRVGETVSFGVFYKNFTNPIESRTIITSEQPQFTYINAYNATNYGAELELRKSLAGSVSNRVLQNFSINLNASYIFSEVDLGDITLAQERVRPLQGQSPFIVNAGLYYQDDEKNFSARVNYNIYGKRIYSVGDVLFPTIYEMPRHSLDLTISKKVSNLLTLKAGVTDILNAAFRFRQDSDRNNGMNGNDHEVFAYKRGSLFSMSATFSLHKDKK